MAPRSENIDNEALDNELLRENTSASPPETEASSIDPDAEAKRQRFLKADRISDIVFYILMGIIILASILYRVFLNPVRVSGNSMNPTYNNGDILISSKDITPETIVRGSVVVFKGDETSGRYYVKRVVGIPGDKLICKDGVLYVNGVAENAGYEKMLYPHNLSEEYSVPSGEYYVLGDNRNDSRDSRFFGSVPIDELDYVVIRPLFPLFGK